MAAGRRFGLIAGIYTGVGVLQRGFTFLILPFVTRVVPPSDYGAVSVVVVCSALIASAMAGSVEVSIFRSEVRSSAERAELQWTAFLYLYFGLPVVGALFGGALFVFGGSLLGIRAELWIVGVVAAMLSAAVGIYALSIVRAQERLHLFVALGLATVVLQGCTKVVLLLVMNDKGLAWLLSDLVASLVLWVWTVAQLRPIVTRVPSAVVRQLFRESMPQLPHRVAFWAVASLSRPLLLVFASLSAVGVYSLALNLSAVVGLVLGELNRSTLVSYAGEELPGPTRRTAEVARMQFIAAFLLPAVGCVGLFLVGPLVIGNAYRDAYSLAAILMIGQVAYGLYTIPMNYIVQTAGRSGLSWQASVTGAAVIFGGICLAGLAEAPLRYAAVANVGGYAAMAAYAFLLLSRSRLGVDIRKILPSVIVRCISVCSVLLGAFSLSGGGRASPLYLAAAIGAGVATFAVVTIEVLRSRSRRAAAVV